MLYIYFSFFSSIASLLFVLCRLLSAAGFSHALFLMGLYFSFLCSFVRSNPRALLAHASPSPPASLSLIPYFFLCALFSCLCCSYLGPSSLLFLFPFSFFRSFFVDFVVFFFLILRDPRYLLSSTRRCSAVLVSQEYYCKFSSDAVFFAASRRSP